MFGLGKLDPKKMSQAMKQLGISQQEIDAERVIIEKKDGKIVINSPSVIKVNMSGQEMFQISGTIEESAGEESEQLEKDIGTIAEKTGKSREECAIVLEKNNGDIAKTILELNE